MSLYCHRCGSLQKNPNAQFCFQCGAPLRAAGATPPGGIAPPPAQTPSDQPVPSLPMPHLQVRWPGQPPYDFAITKPSLTLGRAPDNDLVLSYPTVSGHHARLECRDHAWLITDLQSTNGTAVNGQRIQPQQPQPLAHGDVVRMGDPQGNSISLTFQDPEGLAPSRNSMVLNTGLLVGEAASLLIGRNPQSHIPLPSPQVSWQHARIDRTPQGDVLTDLQSTNGTFVNGQRITVHPLRQGDTIQIGPYRLAYTASGLAASAQVGLVRLDAIGLNRQVTDRKTHKPKLILNDVTMSIQPGEFVAVVGGSGAGKSTLMKALNGQSRATDGQVLFNGDDFYAHLDQYRSMMGYVPQQDIVHRDLTVEGALRYAARLRLPPDMRQDEIEKRIDDALGRLDMVDKKKDTIATLSGGQLKRVNIAVEMLADPDLFFLDEPSSGLDPGTEKKLMYDMQRVADSGKTVILITHATDNVGLCDHVAFMGYGGKLVFFGPPHEALQFFQAQSFADIYLKLAKPSEVDAWQQKFQSSPLYQKYVQSRVTSQMQPRTPPEKVKSSRLGLFGNIRQFGILTSRYFELVARSKLSLFILLAVMPLIGVLMLSVSSRYWLTAKYDPECADVVDDWSDADAVQRCINYHLVQETDEEGKVNASYVVANRAQTLLFIMSFACVLLGIFAAVFEIIKEMPIYNRERMINLGLWPYLMSKFVVLSGFSFIQGLSLLVVIALGVRLPSYKQMLPAVVEIYITLLLTIWASTSLGLWISSFADNNSAVYIILPILIVHIIFAGAFFDLKGPTEWVSYGTITRWSLENLGASTRLNTLNQLSRSRVIPDIHTEREFEFEAPKIVTETITHTLPITCPPAGPVIPVEVPGLVITPTTEMTTTTKTITYTDPITSDIPINFQLGFECMQDVTTIGADGTRTISQEIDLDCTRRRMIGRWLILGGFVVGFQVLSAITLKVRERQAR